MAHKNANADNGTQPTNTNTTDTNNQPTNQQPQPTLVLFTDADTLQAQADTEQPTSALCYWFKTTTNGTTVYFNKSVWQVLHDNGVSLVRVDANGKRVPRTYINSQQLPTTYKNIVRVFKDNADTFTDDTARREQVASTADL